ncbi:MULTISPECIES: molecular chaperone [Providencia]|uniref:fimbrial biogenesis chaperone n=1 Tax=Providencia TaxID=586 RepID=UPI001BD377A2|nr:molecular chaperone [Providencia rettgeri]ELR5075020.1 molecular chaperone [Providencia stuartii]ELR5070795.1 molecular chaperone [Providencia rettgeri]ELR5221900.1 molecular chaperone [Providencia rettgeri]MDX7321708.1 molecular chaperone [Providencia rettgeri]UPS63463.1 molecular chaperone [Providencia rettgeri]
MVLKIRYFSLLSHFSLLLLASSFSWADGVSLDATRIVYPQGDKSVSIAIKNSHSHVSYLTRTFMTSESQDSNVPFETTPPVFKIAPNSRQEVRVLEKSNNLPKDRESLFFFHATMVAGQSQKVDGDGLNIAYDHVIKVFYRPKNLPLTSDEAQKKLVFQSQGNQLKVTNNSPYYINLAQISINKQKINMSMEKGNTTIAPYSSLQYPITSNMHKGTVIWRAITDLGGTNEFKAQLP